MKKAKSLPKLRKIALDLFSYLVKLEYYLQGKLFCYTCKKPLKLNTTDCQLGHYLPRGAYPGLTFHKNNSRPQCYRCNCFLHGNTIEFRNNLIEEIGEKDVLKLESLRHESIKLTRSDYEFMIEDYKTKIKELQ